jgi:hypothetical protein
MITGTSQASRPYGICLRSGGGPGRSQGRRHPLLPAAGRPEVADAIRRSSAGISTLVQPHIAPTLRADDMARSLGAPVRNGLRQPIIAALLLDLGFESVSQDFEATMNQFFVTFFKPSEL